MLYLCISCCDNVTGIVHWTQSLAHARQKCYQWASPINSNTLFSIVPSMKLLVNWIIPIITYDDRAYIKLKALDCSLSKSGLMTGSMFWMSMWAEISGMISCCHVYRNSKMNTIEIWSSGIWEAMFVWNTLRAVSGRYRKSSNHRLLQYILHGK